MAEIIQYRGKPIVYLNWAGTIDPKEALERIDAARKLVATQPLKSTRMLTCVEGARFDRDVIDKLKGMLKANEPYVLCSAIVGLSGLLKVMFGTLVRLTGRNIKIFSTLEEAKDWLVKQE